MEPIQTQRGAPCLFNDGHRYRSDKKRESHTTWRCCLKGCPSRCTTDHSAIVFLKKPSDHAHEKLSTPQIDIEKARTSVKRKAVEDMHAHVDKMVCEKISASSLSYKHVIALKSAVYRERCKLRPTIPKSIEDVFSAAESQAFGLKSFDVIIRDEPNKILVITSEDNLLHLSACENILGDGTFKSCPIFFEQLYTLHGYKDGIYIPSVFALLPDKKKPTYIRMLQFL